MIFGKRIFTSLIVIFLLITLFNISSGSSVNQASYIVDEPDFDGYIIQFNEEPVLRFKNRFVEKVSDVFLTEWVQKYKDGLLSLHKRAKDEITDLLGGSDSAKDFFSTEFFDLFNGICIKNVQDDVVNEIINLPYVKDVVPNYKIHINLDKSVPLVSAKEIWSYHDKNGKSLTGNGVKIAIIDSGVNYNHPDLKDNYVGGFDFVNEDNAPMDDHGHGTHCAGIALGSGKSSDYKYVGVAPMASLFAYKVIKNDGEGSASLFVSAMEEAVNRGVDIISLSLGNNDELAHPDSFLSLAADTAVDAGVVVVAAAGNNGEDGPISSPGCARKVICVGASDDYDNVADFSSRGPVNLGGGDYLIKPDIVAPGVNIISANKFGDYTSRTGTSMATPHVAGAVALILQENPDLTPGEVKTILKENVVDLGVDENISGSGRINVSASIKIDDEIIIKSPYRVTEGKNFEVSIRDNNDNPVKGIIFLWSPSHFPRLKYGASVSFNAPIILSPFKSSLKSKIFIFDFKKHLSKNVEIIVTNKLNF
jgi:subtilisin family serine protease